MGVFENARHGPRTGGDAVREHIRNVTGSEDAYVFAYRSLEVHAYILAERSPTSCTPRSVCPVSPRRSRLRARRRS